MFALIPKPDVDQVDYWIRVKLVFVLMVGTAKPDRAPAANRLDNIGGSLIIITDNNNLALAGCCLQN